jgi:glycosyltransferase involved in cell wall biosynthesis
MTANSNLPRVSVVIPTHNPRMDYLARVIDALRAQTLSPEQWELLVVDNASKEMLDGRLDLSWHPDARVVREEAVGLTNARLRGFAETRGEVIVLVDDDNLLAPDYLEQAVRIAKEHPFLGVWSGNVTLELEPGSEEPRRELRHLLCERVVERNLWSNDPSHWAANPWGAGECVRRQVAEAYADLVDKEPRRRQLDLQGQDLVYGGDTDIAYTGCKNGWGMGVFTALQVTHLTPKHRCTEEYLLRRYEAQAFSNVLHHWIETGGLPARRRDLVGWLGVAVRGMARGSFHRAMVAAQRRGMEKGFAWVKTQGGAVPTKIQP